MATIPKAYSHWPFWKRTNQPNSNRVSLFFLYLTVYYAAKLSLPRYPGTEPLWDAVRPSPKLTLTFELAKILFIEVSPASSSTLDFLQPRSMHSLFVLIYLASFLCQWAARCSAAVLPIVDLGYTQHQATVYNSTGDFYVFKNIRYATPPLSAARFRRPSAPAVNRTLQDGSIGSYCPQASPLWSIQFSNPNATLDDLPPPSGDEDCLFLDVTVPAEVLSGRKQVPVLVWIHGGGFVNGYKERSAPLAGLVAASKKKLIIVAINYRLGAFGFLSGTEVRRAGDSNAGLLDQRFALEWIQTYIRQFNGDNSRVTILGESAGGGSVLHQITAYASRSPPPFARAILQSPSTKPALETDAQYVFYERYRNLLGCDSLDCIRGKSSYDLQVANIRFVAPFPYGEYGFGPAVDGPFVPALPGRILLSGAYDHSLDIMAAHNANEAIAYVNSSVVDYDAFIKSYFKFASTATLDYISGTLYPAGAFANIYDRLAATIIDSRISCNTDYLARAYDEETFNYFFAVPPAYHASDLAYTFYNGPSTSVINNTIANYMQNYITNFALSGNPNGPSLPKFPTRGALEGGALLRLNVTGVEVIQDGTKSKRCAWWQRGLYTR